MKVHWHKGTVIMGETLCGRMVEYMGILGNSNLPVSCKTCKKMHKKRMKKGL